MVDMRDTGDFVSNGDNGGFGVEGPPRRTTGIELHPPHHTPLGAPELPEEDLIAAVQERLGREPFDCRLVEINRAGRRIVLYGAVESETAVEFLGSAAAGVPGVVELENELVVDPQALKNL